MYLRSPEAKKYKNIFIDSLTDIGEVICKYEEDKYEMTRKPSEKRNGFEIWGNYGKSMAGFVKSIRDMSHFNVFFTCLTKEEKDGLEIIERPLVPGESIKNQLKGWFDVVMVYKIFIDAEGKPHRKIITDIGGHPLAKDRSGTLDLYEDPNLNNIMNKVLN